MSTGLIIGGVAAILALLLAGYLLIRKHGRQAAEGDQAKKGVGNAQTANRIDNNVHRLDGDDRERLLNRRD